MTYFKERNGCRRPFRRPMFFATLGLNWTVSWGNLTLLTGDTLTPTSGKAALRVCSSCCCRQLLRHGAGQECLSTMDDCLSSFRLQHNVSDGEANEGILWEETSIAALQRLLEYAHGEVTDSLSDQRCAEYLKLCIEHLKGASPA